MTRWLWLSLVMCAPVWGCGDEVVVEGQTGANCGPVTCANTEYCCDATCGLCEEHGVACDDGCAE